MCRASRSAHGSISTALNAEAFPHDFADSPTTGSSRMCNTARARTNTEPFSPDHRRCSGAGSAPRSATTMTGPGVPGPLGEPRGRAPGGRFRAPGGCFRGSDRPIGVPVAAVARLAAPFPGPATALPEGSAVVQVVQICHKGPDCVGAPEKNRWYSALSSAADPAVGRLCGRFGHTPAPDRPRSPTRTTPRPAFPHRRADRRRITRVGCAVSDWSGRSCTFDRDPLSEDPRNHAETPRRSTPVRSSHVQTGALCTWESANERLTIRKNRGITRKTRGQLVKAPLSDVQYPHYPREEPAPPQEPGPVQIPRSGRRGPPGAPSPAPRPSPAEPRSQRPASGRGRRHRPSAARSRNQPAISRTGPSSPWGRLGCSTAHGPSV